MYSDFYDDGYNEYENSEEINDQLETFNQMYLDGSNEYNLLIANLDIEFGNRRDIA